MKTRNRLASAVIVATMCCSSSALAQPRSDYYMTVNSGANFVVGLANSSNTNTVATQNGSEFALVCRGDVRTIGNNQGQSGALYGLNLSAKATQFPNTIPGSSFGDATTDGVRIYAINFNTNDVVVFAMDYTNPQTLFTLPGNPNDYLGITFEPNTNSLWCARWFNGTTIDNYDLGGNLLSMFDVGHNMISSLARDPVDGTLWAGDFNNAGVYNGYDTAGTMLDTVNYGGAFGPTIGGEFNIGKPTKLKNLTHITGSLKRGSLSDLNEADGTVVTSRGQMNPDGSQTMVMDITAKVKTGASARTFIDILVEGKISEPFGIQQVFLMNFVTGLWELFDVRLIGKQTDTLHISDFAANFLNGRTVMLRVVHDVPAPSKPNKAFKSKIDAIQMRNY